MRRHALGIIALLLLAGGIGGLLYVGVDDSQSSMLASVFLRAGLVLGAIWLAFPQLLQLLRRVPAWMIGVVAVALLIVIRFPRTIFYLGPLIAALALLQFLGYLFTPAPRRRRKRKPRSSSRQPQNVRQNQRG